MQLSLSIRLLITVFLVFCIVSRCKISPPSHSSTYAKLVDEDGKTFESYFRISPSINSWENIELSKKFTVLSMSVDHHSDASWYIPSFHAKGSIGYNRTVHGKGFLTRPYACTLRFLAVSLESNLQGYQTGGTGYVSITFETEKKTFYHGYDTNETNKVHCYYLTNKDTGSEFIDKPKTLGLAIYCPILLDDEVGPFEFRRQMEQGYFCRPLADYSALIELYLRPSAYIDPMYFAPGTNSNNSINNVNILNFVNKVNTKSAEISSEFISTPSATRQSMWKEQIRADGRVHAACTVQTFQHSFSGAMLYMFIKYYQLMGWRVIVYDRFGAHKEYVKDLLNLPGVDYYPFTVYQLAQPSKYNAKYKAEAGSEMKTFYKMEANWGYSSKKLADTADQDMDKTRTYDYARLEYSYLDSILFVDADELFFCPQFSGSIEQQREAQQRLHHTFHSRGTEEMRYVRIPYSGRAPAGYEKNEVNRTLADFTNHTGECMLAAYRERSLVSLSRCWSSATSFDNFPKSSDMASVCPFHYNHWSCDGMRGGGRDFTKNRCRCKVSFDMQNEFTYTPHLKKCHLLHFNDNKYRFQSKRTKHVYDKGDVTQPCALANMLDREKEKV